MTYYTGDTWSRAQLRGRLAALIRPTRGPAPASERHKLVLSDVAGYIGTHASSLANFAHGRLHVSDDLQRALTVFFWMVDNGSLVKEQDGSGRWMLRRVRTADPALAKVAAPAQPKAKVHAMTIEITAAGPRLRSA